MENLKSKNRWICHKGKVPKMPILTDQTNCSGDYYETAGTTYEKAAEAKDKWGYDGLGILLGQGLIGVDLDHCIKDGKLSDFAMEVIKQLDSYTEISPSGKGVHILLYGNPDIDSLKTNDIEIYTAKRYFTFTGKTYAGKTEIRSGRDAEISKLYQRVKAAAGQATSSGAGADQGEIVEGDRHNFLIKRLMQYCIDNAYNKTITEDHIREYISGVNDEYCKPPIEDIELTILSQVPKYRVIGRAKAEDNRAKIACITDFQEDIAGEYNAEEVIKKLEAKSEARGAQSLFTSDDVIRKMQERIKEDPEGEPESLDKFHKLDKNGRPKGVFDVAIVEDIKASGGTIILGGVPYLYDKGVFRPDKQGARLTTEIKKRIYPEFISSTTLARVYNLFLKDADLCLEESELNRYPTHWVNFQNGFYDPIEGKLIPHDPKYRATNQLPHNFTPGGKPECPELDRWLTFITPDPDDREMLLEYIGYCMTRDTRQQKFLILYGSGGTGKSTLIRLLEEIIGEENTSNIPLRELSYRFSAFGLVGKLLNSCADIDEAAIKDVSLIKQLMGEDKIQAEAKGKNAFWFRSCAKQIFSTNELPLILSERSNGFYRRLLILTMNRAPKSPRADFTELLIRGIDRLIYLAMDALETMYIQGSIMNSKNSQDAVNALWRESDTVEAWLYDRCERDIKARTDRTELFDNYSLWCDANESMSLSLKSFYKALRTKGFEDVSYKGCRVFKGVKLKKKGLRVIS